MKQLRKFLVFLTASLMVLVVGGIVLAEDPATSGTITISNASQGQTYTLYKLFDATHSGVAGDNNIAYTLPAGKTLDATSSQWFTKDSAGNISATAAATSAVGTDAFATWAEGFGEQVAQETATSNTLVFSNLPFGYYFIKSGLGAVITVNSTTPTATVIDKNETKPTPPTDNKIKHIVTSGGTLADKATAKIGETVKFQILVNATNFVTENGVTTQIKKYTVEDTPNGLTIDKNTVHVYAGTQDITNAEGVDVTTDASGKMTVTVPWAKADGSTLYNSPIELKVTYDAVVNKAAAEGTATNSAAVTYNENGTITPGDHPTVYTYKVTLTKVKAGTTTELTGAEFKLYDVASGGNAIKVVKESAGVYHVAEANEAGATETIEAGKAVIKGLKGSTKYYLEETKAPKGYNKLTERKAVETKDAAGKDADASITIENNAGTALPSTGSIGTTLFYLAGSVLLIGALVFMISKRRMRNA